MTSTNALVFLLIGVAAFQVPDVWPQAFLLRDLTGSNTSALWLRCMGPVLTAVGLHAFFLNEILPFWQMSWAWQSIMERELEPEPVTT